MVSLFFISESCKHKALFLIVLIIGIWIVNRIFTLPTGVLSYM